MTRHEGETNNAPKPVACYSQSVRIGRLVAVAGQAGIDPASGDIASHGIGQQTRQTFRNVEAALKAVGATLDDVLRVDVFLSSFADFEAMNQVYAEVFSPPFPARTTVVAGLAPGLRIEATVLASVASDSE